MTRQKWTSIKDRMKPETRVQIEAEARGLADDLHPDLSQLRKAPGLTQEALTVLLGVIAARSADGVEVPIPLSDIERPG